MMTGLDVGAVPEELRIPFDPVFDDGPTVINNPSPRPRRETQRLVTLAHARALDAAKQLHETLNDPDKAREAAAEARRRLDTYIAGKDPE